MSTILVTGGAGYIGSHTIIELINKGYDKLLSIDNFSRSQTNTFDRVKGITGMTIENANIDITDKVKLEAFFSENKIDSIIHFAAYKAVGESVDEPLLYYHNNLVSLTNILACCAKFNVKNFIFSSSCTIYGQPDELPVSENSPIKPAESPYGQTKQMGEDIIRAFCQANPWFNAIALRYFNPVGAHSSGKIGELPIGVPNNLVPFITQTASGMREKLTVFGGDYDTRDGSCVRDYIHVSDIAEAHVLAVELLDKSDNDGNFDAFNLGTGVGVTVLEAIKAFEKVSGKSLAYEVGPRRSGDIEKVFADNTKSKNELGWVAKRGVDEMMSTAWAWQQQLDSEA